MVTLKARDIDRVLVQLGFERILKADHVRYRLKWEGLRDVIGTKISHGDRSGEISGGLINRMAREIHVSKNEFVQLVSGEQGLEWYVEHLRRRGDLR